MSEVLELPAFLTFSNTSQVGRLLNVLIWKKNPKKNNTSLKKMVYIFSPSIEWHKHVWSIDGQSDPESEFHGQSE